MVERKENIKNRGCPVHQTVREIQEGEFCKVASPFLLVMQTAQQRDLLVKYGNTVTLMDAIYKTCKYNFPCFFLTVKTSVGIGQVVATIIPEFETEEMLLQGLQIVKTWNPTWNPSFFMTDKSAVELNAMPRHIQKLSTYYAISIESKHRIAGSTRTVMESQSN